MTTNFLSVFLFLFFLERKWNLSEQFVDHFWNQSWRSPDRFNSSLSPSFEINLVPSTRLFTISSSALQLKCVAADLTKGIFGYKDGSRMQKLPWKEKNKKTAMLDRNKQRFLKINSRNTYFLHCRANALFKTCTGLFLFSFHFFLKTIRPTFERTHKKKKSVIKSRATGHPWCSFISTKSA